MNFLFAIGLLDEEEDCPELLDCQSDCTTKVIETTIFQGCIAELKSYLLSNSCVKECEDIYE